MLSREQQSALGQLAVFEAPLTVELAEEFIKLDNEEPGGVAPVLESLVSHNLVYQYQDASGDTVFDMLETIREFVRLRSRESTAESVAQRYRHLVCKTGEELAREPVGADGPRNLYRLARLRTDLTQVLKSDVPEMSRWSELRGQAGFALLTLLFRLGEREGHHQLLGLLPSLFNAPSKLDDRAHDLLFEVEILKLEFYRNTDLHEEAVKRAGDLLTHAEERHDTRGMVKALVRLAQQRSVRDPELARQACERALILMDGGGYGSERASILQVLGIVEMDLSNLEASEKCLRNALEAADSVEDELQRGSILTLLANLALDNEDPKAAMTYLHEAESIFTSYGEYRRTTVTKGLKAICRFVLGEPVLKEFVAVIERFKRIGDRMFVAYYRLQAAEAYLERCQWKEARQQLEMSLSVRRQLQAIAYSIPTMVNLAMLNATEGEKEKAEALLDEALAIQRDTGTTYGEYRLIVCRTMLACFGSTVSRERVNQAIAKVHSKGTQNALRRLLARGLGEEEQLTVAQCAMAFLRSGREPVNLERRAVPRRVLNALVEDHLGARVGLDKDTLMNAGWPGEELVQETGANRVYVTISILRKLGLDGLIVNEGGRYRLRRGLVVKRVGEPESLRSTSGPRSLSEPELSAVPEL